MFHLQFCFLGFLAGLLVIPHHHFICFNITILLSKSATYSCCKNLSFHFKHIKIISIINSKEKCQVGNISYPMLQMVQKP